MGLPYLSICALVTFFKNLSTIYKLRWSITVCCVISTAALQNPPSLSDLKPHLTLSQTASVGKVFGSGSRGWVCFWIRLGRRHLKAWLGLEGPLLRWPVYTPGKLALAAVPRFLGCPSVLTKRQLGSLGVRVPRDSKVKATMSLWSSLRSHTLPWLQSASCCLHQGDLFIEGGNTRRRASLELSWKLAATAV